MFGVGFDREVFTPRHPSMGVSIKDLETYWKTYYPQAKAGLKNLNTTPLPGTTNLTTNAPARVPAPASGTSAALLWVGGLTLLGAGAWYVMRHPRTFGFGKKK